ncbi:MAG: MFS transporter [Treponema sp.]|jgi:MFS family permease|nr:MFS transporter [Treponema sp.]
MNIFRVFIETVAPLKKRNVSLFLGGQVVSQFGSMLQGTALSWVVWEFSKSTEALGITNMLHYLPYLLFGPFAGVLADRLSRRGILLGLQAAEMALALLFAFLLQADSVSLWHIYLFSFLSGCILGIDSPVGAAYLGDLAGKKRVREAVALNNVILQAARTAAPAAAGILLAAVNSSRIFFINGAASLFIFAALLMISFRPLKNPLSAAGGEKFIDALRFIKGRAQIQDLIIASMCITFFSGGVSNLVPAVVTERLHAGPEALGFITAAFGAGPLIGAILIVPFFQKIKKPGTALLLSLAWMGAWFAAAAFSGSVWLWIVGMFAANLSNPAVLVIAAGLIQFLTPEQMYGRVMGIWMMLTFGMMPFGPLVSGFLSSGVGIAPAILIFAFTLILAAALMALFRGDFRRWLPHEENRAV